jgi:hypothetical protein
MSETIVVAGIECSFVNSGAGFWYIESADQSCDLSEDGKWVEYSEASWPTEAAAREHAAKFAEPAEPAEVAGGGELHSKLATLLVQREWHTHKGTYVSLSDDDAFEAARELIEWFRGNWQPAPELAELRAENERLREANAEAINTIHGVVNERNTASDKASHLQRRLDDLMDLLRQSAMEHGDCNSGERYGGIPKACTACMAKLKLDDLRTQWKGRMVTLT